VVLDVKHRSVATASMHGPIMCCDTIMVVACSSDFSCLQILGGTIGVKFHMASMQISGSIIRSFEKDHPKSYSCTISTFLSLSDDRLVEDVVSMFGLCHRRWTITPPLLNPGFNSRCTLSLSSVTVIAYIQLNPIPCEHFLDKPLGESPAGHQLDRTTIYRGP
jgi:hypothetical protein